VAHVQRPTAAKLSEISLVAKEQSMGKVALVTSAGHEYSASWLGVAIKCEDDLDQVVCSQQTFCKGRSSDTGQTTR